MNYMEAAFAPAEMEHKNKVLKDTWGHLAPNRNKIYRGHIVFTITTYGDMVIIDKSFVDLPDSPWFFDAMNEFVFEDWRSLPEGAVLRWEGTFKNYRFEGLTTTIYQPA